MQPGYDGPGAELVNSSPLASANRDSRSHFVQFPREPKRSITTASTTSPKITTNINVVRTDPPDRSDAPAMKTPAIRANTAKNPAMPTTAITLVKVASIVAMDGFAL